jgi:hypothetical protein
MSIAFVQRSGADVMTPNDKKEQDDYSRAIADLMVESDKNLDRVYRRSVICTLLIAVGIGGLLVDLIFFTLSDNIGLLLYYSCLIALLIVLITFLYSYFDYSRRTADINEEVEEARNHLLEQQKLEEFRDKLRKRIERMRNEQAWFKQLLLPGAFEGMDKERTKDRGNEEFEYFVRKYFEKMGFRLESSSVVTDSGVYMLMTKGGKGHLVYPVHPPTTVGQEDLANVNRELMQSHVEHALVITAGTFTEKGREYVGKRSILLYDRPALLEGVNGIISALNTRIQDEESLLTAENPAALIAKMGEDAKT